MSGLTGYLTENGTELKEGEIHINPKTVLTEIIPFKIEDLD